MLNGRVLQGTVGGARHRRAAIGVGGLASGDSGRARSARVQLRDASGVDVGTVHFVDHGGGVQVRVDLHLDPAMAPTDAYHGFHVHANDDPANGSGCLADPAQPPATWFTAVDGHWRVEGQSHAAHLGDLASLYVTADGTVDARFTTQRFRAADLAGRAVIIHFGPDNFGNVPVGTAANQYLPNSPEASTATANTGNAGVRIACGVVGER